MTSRKDFTQDKGNTYRFSTWIWAFHMLFFFVFLGWVVSLWWRLKSGREVFFPLNLFFYLSTGISSEESECHCSAWQIIAQNHLLHSYLFIIDHKFLIETDIMIYYQNSNKQLRVWLTNYKNVFFSLLKNNVRVCFFLVVVVVYKTINE